MADSSHLLDRVALEIALGRPDVGDAALQAVQACVSAGASGARARIGNLTVDAGVLLPERREWVADGVELLVSGDVDAQHLVGALALATARMKQTDERRKLLHDLRGLLAVVSGQTEMLSMAVWGAVTPAQKKALETIERQIDRMAPLLDRLRG